jgi:hypothetical protein
MEMFVYYVKTGEILASITGESNQECERATLARNFWDEETMGWAYNDNGLYKTESTQYINTQESFYATLILEIMGNALKNQKWVALKCGRDPAAITRILKGQSPKTASFQKRIEDLWKEVEMGIWTE